MRMIRRIFRGETLGLLTPLFAIALFLFFTIRGQLHWIDSPLLIGGTAYILAALCGLFLGLKGLLAAAIFLTIISFYSNAPQLQDASVLPLASFATWLVCGGLFLWRFLKGWKKQRFLKLGGEIEKLQEQIRQLETFTNLKSTKETLSSFNQTWLDQLDRMTDSFTRVLALLATDPNMKQYRDLTTDFRKNLYEVQELLSAQKLLLGDQPPEVTKESSPGKVVEMAVEEVQEAYRSLGVELEVELDDGNALGNLDLKLMVRAVQELLLNALEASRRGSKVKISTQADFRGGRSMIEIADRGKGVLPDLLPHIFKPFFSTYPDKAGLGLSIAKRIVGQHGGSIAVIANEPRGTIFRIRLPLKQPNIKTTSFVEESTQKVPAQKEKLSENV